MIENSLARHTRTREQRGISLFNDRGDEIEHVRGWKWLVPSCTGEILHAVDLKGERCECLDFEQRRLSCKHIYAARIARSKSGECAGCSRKVRYRDLHHVGDDHPTFFEGDELCECCAVNYGLL